MRLLIVEDDVDLADAVIAAFARRKVTCDHAPTLGDAFLFLEATRFAAVVLDLGLPDGDGLAVVRHLRHRRDSMPVIVLTARGDVSERIGGLNTGADDYLAKPFDFEELFARLTAVLRRRSSFQGELVELANTVFDLQSQELSVAGGPVALSAREAELIALLLRRAGHVVSKRIVEDQLFGLSDNFGSNAVEVYVHRVRRKLEQACAGIRIETIRGVGYMIRAIA